MRRSQSSNEKSISDHFRSGGNDNSSSGSLSNSSSSNNLNSTTSKSSTEVTIELIAHGSYDDHMFTAMYCSNNYLIFRYVGQSKVPLYKYLIWETDPSKKIVSMCFDPTANWLLCLQLDTSCKVIPIYLKMCKKVSPTSTMHGDVANSGNSSAATNTEKSDKLSNWVTSRLLKTKIGGSFTIGGLGNSDQNSGKNKQSNHNPQSDIRVIPQLTKKGLVGSSCVWWTTSKSHYGIIATTSGNIFFVNLTTPEGVVQRKLKIGDNKISKIELVTSSSETYLLIAVQPSSKYLQLVIEQKVDHHTYDNIITSPHLPQNSSKSILITSGPTANTTTGGGPNQQQLQPQQPQSPFQYTNTLFSNDRFQMDRLLTTQKGTDNSNTDMVVVSFLKPNSKLEIYEPLYLNKYPLYVYQLPSNTNYFYFTKNVTIISEIDTRYNQQQLLQQQQQNNYSATSNSNYSQLNNSQNEEIMNVSIISNIIAGTASNSKYINNQAVMQTFLLSPGEVVLGITKSLNNGESNSNGGSGGVGISLSSSSNFINSGDGNSGVESNANKNTILPTCYLWTNFAAYELKPKKSPEEIFFELVSKNLEKTDGEALGKTFRLDLLSLYETAADHSFELGQYGRALDLYFLSGVKTSKLVLKFLEIGRMDIIMTHLKAVLLHQSETFNRLDKKKLSDILLQCYLQKLLSSREDFKPLETEFANFLSTNKDYADTTALQLFSKNGLLDYFFAVAHSRQLVPMALNMLLESDILHLDTHNISFLQSGYSQELKSHSNGMIFDCLPPNIQVKLIIEDPNNIPRYFRRLYHILPYLDEKELLDIAQTFDPFEFEPPTTTIPPNSSGGSKVSSPQFQQQQQQQQQQLSNLYNDPEFESHVLLPGRQSEILPVKNEEYFEFYILTLLSLINLRKKKNKDDNNGSSNNNSGIEFLDGFDLNGNHEQRIVDGVDENSGNENNSNQIDEQDQQTDNSKNNKEEEHEVKYLPDPDLLVYPMPPLKNEKKAVKLSCGYEHVAVITDDGELFTWGNNINGQLGHGLEIGKSQSTPKRVDFFGSRSLVMVECGGEHTIAVDSNSQIYSWGSDRFGQLGHGTKGITVNRPKIIEDLSGQKLTAIAAGYAHTLILKKSGDLYSFGLGEYGQLGHGSYQSKSVPTRVEINYEIAGIHHGGKIKQIACGYAHSVFCTDNGEVYSWGQGSKGQLGHGSTEDVQRPKLIESLRGITNISCGHFHTVVTTDLKNVYSWGQGEHMRLGHGSEKDEIGPKAVDFYSNMNISIIVSGLYHTIAVTQQKHHHNNSSEQTPIYICGGGEHGKLGLGGDLKSPFFDKPIPAAIPSINASNISTIKCGSEFTGMITTNGGLYLWGYGHSGQIGNGALEDVMAPTKISLNDSKSNGSLLQTDDKKIRYSQEGLEELLRTQPNSYRPFNIINKARQYDNWDVVATVYDIMKDYKSTLECKLIGLKNNNFTREKETNVLLQLLHQYIVKDSVIESSSVASKRNTSFTDSPPMISTFVSPMSHSPPLNGSHSHHLKSSSASLTPLNMSSHEIPAPSSSMMMSGDGSITLNSVDRIKETLIIMIFNYWKEKQLSIPDLEKYILYNINSFSTLLSSILQTNASQPLPLLLEFSATFYLYIIKNYLQSMKNQSERERRLQKVSEKVLWTNIRDNLEKDLLQRSKIEIPALPLDAGPIHPFEKDIAFTCNHFFPKRVYYGTILPEFKLEAQKLLVPGSETLKYILDEYNQKTISLSCPVCLFHSLRDLQNDEMKKDIIKLFKLS
eukprot:gene4737-5913_t